LDDDGAEHLLDVFTGGPDVLGALNPAESEAAVGVARTDDDRQLQLRQRRRDVTRTRHREGGRHPESAASRHLHGERLVVRAAQRVAAREREPGELLDLALPARQREERVIEDGNHDVTGVPREVAQDEVRVPVRVTFGVRRNGGAPAVPREEADGDAVVVQGRHANALLTEGTDDDKARS
jgi:transposase InsO family protein